MGRELCRAGSGQFLSLLGTHQGPGTRQSCGERGEHPLRPGPETPPPPHSCPQPQMGTSQPLASPGERLLGWHAMGTCRLWGSRCVVPPPAPSPSRCPPGCRDLPPPQHSGSGAGEGTICHRGLPAAASPPISAGRVNWSWRLPPALPVPPCPRECCPTADLLTLCPPGRGGQGSPAPLLPPSSLQRLMLPRGKQ